MMKSFTHTLPLAAIALLLLVLAGCNLVDTTDAAAEPIAVQGTWLLENPDWNDEQWVITESSITYQSVGDSETTTTYAAEIVEYSNEELNAGESELVADGTTEGLGYAVIRFTEVDGAGTGEVDKFQVFRWGTNQNNAAARDFTQGFKNVGEEYPGDAINEVFDTAEEAAAGASIGNGHFSFASQGAELQ